MKPVHLAACARCGSVGKPYQLNDLLEHDERVPAVDLCDQCLHALKYADGRTCGWRLRSRRDCNAGV